MGLMQLMPLTAQYLSVHDPFNPEENITGGIRYFRMLLDHFRGSLRHALAAYNAGPERVKKSGYFPDGSETRDYVDRILLIYGGEQKFKYMPLDGRISSGPIYKMVLDDGTLLFTNTLPASDGSFR
jgi:soluble lytic murein transglycosylase-like protein